MTLPFSATRPAAVALDAEALYRDPHAVLADLRTRGPAHFVRLPDGSMVWLILDYDAAHAALNEPTLIKNWLRATGRIGPDVIGANMITSDPPDHTRLRRLVSRKFTARRIAALSSRIEAVAAELLDRMAAHTGEHDLVAEFAFPLPVSVISELLGVPSLDRAEFGELCASIFDPASDPDTVQRITAYFDGLIDEKRKNPGDDLLSALIRVTDSDAGSLTREELRATTFLLLVAGHATTTNFIANGVLALLDHPDQLAALRADWNLLPGAVEEILRYDGPQPFSTRRFTTEPWQVPGSEIVLPAGETILVALAAADHDEQRFPRPGSFDIRRSGSAHLAFGHGIHYCLGAPLARLQTTTALRALLNRFPDLRLAASAERQWRRTTITRGLVQLPVLIHATAPPTSTKTI
jgi:cytochrome P450